MHGGRIKVLDVLPGIYSARYEGGVKEDQNVHRDINLPKTSRFFVASPGALLYIHGSRSVVILATAVL